MQKVPVGPTTVAAGTFTVASFAAAVVAYATGARDEATISMLVLGGVTLVTSLAGRYGQAIAAAVRAQPGTASVTYKSTAGTTPVNFTVGGASSTASNAYTTGAFGTGLSDTDDADVDDELPPELLDREPDDPADIDPDKGDSEVKL